MAVLSRRRATLAEFDRDVLAPLPSLKQMAEDAYRLGKIGLLELLVSEIEAELDTLMTSGRLAAAFEALQ